MQGKDGAIDLGAQGEVQNRLSEKLLLQGGVENDRIPQGAEGRVGQAAYALAAALVHAHRIGRLICQTSRPLPHVAAAAWYVRISIYQ